MEESNRPYSTLGVLVKDPRDAKITVRLIRQAEAPKKRRRNNQRGLTLLLLDECGSLIEASINHRLIHYYKGYFKESVIYHISNFNVEKNDGKIRLTDHTLAIHFTHLTIVSEVLVDPPTIGKTKFQIYDFKKLLRLANKNQFLPDVVGTITNVWGSKLRCIGSTNKIMAKIVLQDGTKARVSIWDNIASDFRALLAATKKKKFSVIITSVNPKMFSGDLYLNTSHATRFYVNHNLEELEKLRPNIDELIKSPLQEHEMDEECCSMETISQMLSFLDLEEPQERNFFCSARLVEIINPNSWYKICCSKCFNEIDPKQNHTICPSCKDPNIVGIIRYRLEVVVDDETDKGKFFISDIDARKITNRMNEDLIYYPGSQCLDFSPNNNLPPFLIDLLGKKYVFQIRISQFDFRAREKTFSVVGIVSETLTSASQPWNKHTSSWGKRTDLKPA